MIPLVVVGSVALDTVETPHGRVQDGVGGSATYFSMSSSHFTRVGLVGVVGPDFPSQTLEALAARPIDLSGLTIEPSGTTFRWAGRYRGTMNAAETLDTQLNVFADFQPELPAGYRQTPFLFLANIDPDLQFRVLDQVETPLFTACDTMNYWIDHKPDALKKVLERVDGLFVNDAEARQLTGENNIIRALEEVHRLGPRVVVVKRGEYGALLSLDDQLFYAPAYPVIDVCDPTGAGDSFAGGFMGFLARQGNTDTDTLRQAVLCGTLMASFCVERFGPDRFHDLSLEEIRQRAHRIQALTRCPALDEVI
ncbi:MAG: hypothetical protein JW797_08100 [Bradymonadales bacterium]|nr:hypothetical protein [Bradymonadales bacterium]